MKIINIDVADKIELKNVEDPKTGLTKFIKSNLAIPTDNYNNILLNFDFTSPDATEEGLQLFAIFSAKHLDKPITRELREITINDKTYSKACILPVETLTDKNTVTLGIYGFVLNEDNSLKKRISLNPIVYAVTQGSYDENAIDTIEVPDPTIFELYFNKIKTMTSELDEYYANIDRELEELKADTNSYLNTLKNNTELDLNKLKIDTTNDLNTFKENATNNMATLISNTEQELKELENATQDDINAWKTEAEEGLETWKTEADNEISEKLDKMVVSKTLNTEGWYRVAKLNDDGNNGMTCIVNINSRYSNLSNSSITLAVNIVYSKAKITNISNICSSATYIISKARVVKENNVHYLEIYYLLSVPNPIYVDVLEQRGFCSMLNFEAPTDTATVLDEISTEETLITNEDMENEKTNIFKAIGLGGSLPRISEKEMNDITANGFAYVFNCKLNETGMANGYFLNLTYSDSYQVQFYLKASTASAVLQFRRKVAGVWEDFKNV